MKLIYGLLSMLPLEEGKRHNLLLLVLGVEGLLWFDPGEMLIGSKKNQGLS
jgi:hypothetical protein